MGNTPSVTRFHKKGATYTSRWPIVPKRKNFFHGTKEFDDGWIQVGTFDGGTYFIHGHVQSPDGHVYYGNMKMNHKFHFEANLGSYIRFDSPHVFMDGNVVFQNTKNQQFHIRPLRMMVTNKRTMLFYVGNMGLEKGIFTEDATHNVPIPFLTVDSYGILHKHYDSNVFGSQFIERMLGCQRIVENNRIKYKLLDTDRLSNENLLILGKVVSCLR